MYYPLVVGYPRDCRFINMPGVDVTESVRHEDAELEVESLVTILHLQHLPSFGDSH